MKQELELTTQELAKLVPWSASHIRRMARRGTFREGIHFRRMGRVRVFSWPAVVRYIECRPVSGTTSAERT